MSRRGSRAVRVSAALVPILIALWILFGQRRNDAPTPGDSSAPPSAKASATDAPAAASSFGPTIVNDAPAPSPAPPGMVWIPGGEFSMGAEDPRPLQFGGPDPMGDARPIHRVYVDGFWMDATEVTNEEFQAFVRATGYESIAEITPTKEEFPDAPPENLVAGSTVFTMTNERVPLDDHYRWWNYVHGANWRHPEGPDRDLKGREKFPVVQVAYDDAVAYAKWAGKRLPTEAEWEFAARGGAAGMVYAWGNEFQPGGRWMANTFQGEFPVRDTGEDGFVGAAPVAQYPPNAYGLYDLAGNVWEWCSDWYRADAYIQTAAEGAVARNPLGPEIPFDPREPTERKRVHRGGSFLCTDEYCTRYMIGTRGRGEAKTAANHLGFRCVKDPYRSTP